MADAYEVTAEELLQKFAATQEGQKSFVLKCEDNVESTGTGRMRNCPHDRSKMPWWRVRGS